MQTQTSNTLHNAIMEAGSKDRPPMLAPGNYVQWKSRIKRYIETKPNHELIHYCLENPPYKLDWKDVKVPVSEGSLIITTARIRETYKNVSQDIRDQLNAEAEAVQIILTGIYNDIYSTVDVCPNALNEIRAEKIARVANLLALVAQQQPVYHPQTHPTHYTQNSSTRSQQAATKNRGKAIVNSLQPIYDQEPSMVDEDDETRANQDNSLRINRRDGYENQRDGNVVGARENVEQADWRDDTDDDELEDQELEVHYMYMAQLQEVSLDAADSGPIFDDEPLQKVSNDDHYNVFAMKSIHPKQSKSVYDTYAIEQDAQNVIINSLDMNYDREEIDQNDDDNDLAKELTAQTLPPNKKSILKNTNVLAPGMYKLHTYHNQTRTSQLPQDSRKTNKRVSFSTGVIPITSGSRPQLKSNPMGDRVMRNNSQGKKQEVEDQCRNVKLPKNKTSVTACNDSFNAKTLNVNFAFAMCDKCVLIDKHDMCVLNSIAKPIKKTVASESNQKPRNITRKLYERVKLNPQHQSHYLLKILYPVSIYNFIIMSNTNNNMQTQTSNTLHNAIMEAGSKDRSPMFATGDYVQWKSRIKRYIDTKPNHELIHSCLKNPPYEFGWIDKEIPIYEGSPITRTERFQETYKNVTQDIRDQLNAKAEAF
nr:hypothetical protein [Tanacetum cinerariifolium]